MKQKSSPATWHLFIEEDIDCMIIYIIYGEIWSLDFDLVHFNYEISNRAKDVRSNKSRFGNRMLSRIIHSYHVTCEAQSPNIRDNWNNTVISTEYRALQSNGMIQLHVVCIYITHTHTGPCWCVRVYFPMLSVSGHLQRQSGSASSVLLL